jgi:SHS2 domain-containing protein
MADGDEGKRNYKFLEHTADVMFEAYGKSFEEALENAAKALFSIMGNAKPKAKASFSCTAHNIEEMTVQLLADMLAYSDTHGIVFSKFSVRKFDEGSCSILLDAWGEHKQPRDLVKAVTYHELMVAKGKEGWTIRLLLDV